MGLVIDSRPHSINAMTSKLAKAMKKRPTPLATHCIRQRIFSQWVSFAIVIFGVLSLFVFRMIRASP